MRNVTLIPHAYARPLLYTLFAIGVGWHLWTQYSLAGDYNGFTLTNPLVPKSEIQHGGPQRDGIPAIDKPHFIPAAQADFLNDNDRVLGMQQNGVAKAYPLRILNWHEIVNDTLAGTPIVVTYCPLCGTGMAFSPQQQGKTLTFGVSGLLYNSDMLLYDRQTESLWSQIILQAISGPMQGQRLQPLPLAHTTWAAWRTQQPDTLVLSTRTGYHRDYSRDPYMGYASSTDLYFPVAHTDRRYHAKERVIGVKVDDTYKAYPFIELGKLGQSTLEDKIGKQTITLRFNVASRSAEVFDHKGKAIPSINAFWFAWVAFHPDTAVFTTE